MALKDRLWRIITWQHFFLCLILVVTLAMHFAIITNPPDTVLDEIHYVKDARVIIADNETERPEHPPLGKLILVAGFKMFGDNTWGWRFFPILIGTGTIVLFYFICRRLDMSQTATNIATFLLAFENMTFTHSQITMLDIYLLGFMMLTFFFYVSRKYIAAGIALALTGLTKLTGAMAAPVLFVHWLFSRKQGHSKWFALTVVFTVIAFVELMVLLDFAIVKEFTGFLDPVQRIKDMLSLTGSLTFENVTHPALTRPWEWVLGYFPMALYISPIHYNSAVSFDVWALIIPTTLYMIWLSIRRNEAGLFGFSWFLGIYLLWIPLSIITDRSSYPYYFLPAVGAICLGMGIGLGKLIEIFRSRPRGWIKWLSFSFVVLVIVVHAASFIILSPVFNYDYGWFIQMIA